MTVLGFTGTREGMTDRQRSSVAALLRTLAPSAIVHGGCVGADDEVDEMAMTYGIPRLVRPGNIEAKRGAYTSRSGTLIVFPVRPNLTRNRSIVHDCDVLVAAPKGDEELRSGTWSTVRYARPWRRLIVVRPDGTRVEEETGASR